MLLYSYIWPIPLRNNNKYQGGCIASSTTIRRHTLFQFSLCLTQCISGNTVNRVSWKCTLCPGGSPVRPLAICWWFCSSTLRDCRPHESEILHRLLSLFFYLAVSQESHWAENKHWAERWDMKRRTKHVHRSLKTAAWSHVFQATSGSGRLFASVLIIRPETLELIKYTKGWNTVYSSAVLVTLLLCGPVFISELVKRCGESSFTLLCVVIHVHFPLIGVSIGGGMLCTHRAAGT